MPAWRRLRRTRSASFRLSSCSCFVLMIVLTASGLVAGGWQRKSAFRARRPLSWARRRPVGSETPSPRRAGPVVDLSAVDPLAPRYKEWAERAAKYKTVERRTR